MSYFVVFVLIILSGCYFLFARSTALSAEKNGQILHSAPSYHGYYLALAATGPAIVVWIGASLLNASGLLVLSLVILTAVISGFFASSRIKAGFQARNNVESWAIGAMAFVSFLAVITTFSIFLALIAESVRFFAKVPLQDFLFGLKWSPQTAIRADQIGASGAFGIIPLLTGTMLVTLIAMLTAIPLGLFAAIYLTAYASPRVHAVVKPVLELLAGVPTVVYGFFALLIVGPLVADGAQFVGAALGIEINPPAQNALAAGLVMGVMIIPFVSSLSDDVISSIPGSLEEGALAVGARKSEAVTDVILPAAAPGLVGAFLLAVSRAIGETMIVVMAASRSANLTFNPLERVTTITVQIVALLTGDQEFDSAKTLSAFALGLVLFLSTLAINVVALFIVKKYRTRYD